jgi:succinoglycan biosynthesis protein ExoM
MNESEKHISVCICTYKRPDCLRRLLFELCWQETSGLFTFSIVVADNDSAESARDVVEEFSEISSVPIKYCVQPQQSIALTRNSALENADGDFIAFIDDDEFPAKLWLLTLFKACAIYRVDGVLGPVKRYFDQKPPQWLLKSRFYDRPNSPTGPITHWRQCRTGNVLFKRQILPTVEPPFRPAFRSGEDQDFFRRMMEEGHTFMWCADAVAYEVVPPIRWKRTFMLKRALLRGSMEPQSPTFGLRDVVRSLIAVPAYVVALPLALVLGQHRFMHLLVSLFDHLGTLLALLGLNPVKEQYVTE